MLCNRVREKEVPRIGEELDRSQYNPQCNIRPSNRITNIHNIRGLELLRGKLSHPRNHHNQLLGLQEVVDMLNDKADLEDHTGEFEFIFWNYLD